MCEEKETFYLIKPSFWDSPSWMSKGTLNGEEAWLNMGGSGFSGVKDVKVLMTAEVEDDADLPWYLCYATCKPPVGWLDRSGKIHPCGEQEHIGYAHDVLHKEVAQLDKEGWVRIVCEPDSFSPGAAGYQWFGDRPSPEQLRTLQRWGYNLREWMD